MSEVEDEVEIEIEIEVLKCVLIMIGCVVMTSLAISGQPFHSYLHPAVTSSKNMQISIYLSSFPYNGNFIRLN